MQKLLSDWQFVFPFRLHFSSNLRRHTSFQSSRLWTGHFKAGSFPGVVWVAQPWGTVTLSYSRKVDTTRAQLRPVSPCPAHGGQHPPPHRVPLKTDGGLAAQQLLPWEARALGPGCRVTNQLACLGLSGLSTQSPCHRDRGSSALNLKMFPKPVSPNAVNTHKPAQVPPAV